MCGIVGAAARRNVAGILLEGLKRLEYRGYDSAGMVVLDAAETISYKRALGKVAALAAALAEDNLLGATGIAHTRWATHGKPSESNAHPHVVAEEIAVVHNGIIENHASMRAQLQETGAQFVSETDTEIIPNLIFNHLNRLNATSRDRDALLLAVRCAVSELDGAYALGIVSKYQPDSLIAVRHGCPLVIGLGIDENFIASDLLALLPVAQNFIYLEDGDIAWVKANKVCIYNAQGVQVERPVQRTEVRLEAVEKGEFRHFMQKEIFEQPTVIAQTLEGRISARGVLTESFGTDAIAKFAQVKAVTIVACGTSHHAAMVARYWIEALAGIPCQVEVASEYRYRKMVVANDCLFVTISQSGETADTLAALFMAKTLPYIASLAICNVPESALVRESDFVFVTRAGAEIGVASTKAFTTQLTALMMLSLALGRRQLSTAQQEAGIVAELKQLPQTISEVLLLDEAIKKLAAQFVDKSHALFLGRGTQYPVALEGALKLKEISYIHAEAYPAGELKHGPLALVDGDMPVIAIAPNDQLLEKLKSNLQEVQARGGQLYVFADRRSKFADTDALHTIELPEVSTLLAPIVYTVPLQLLAYHVAVLKGTDVDQPRNLAKSVTVE